MPAPLKLVHYTGSDKLAEVMAVCPKIRTFKLFVTESLPKMGATLKNCDNSLDHVTLVYSPRCAYRPRSRAISTIREPRNPTILRMSLRESP